MPSKRVPSWLFASVLDTCVTNLQKSRTYAIPCESLRLDTTNFWIRKLVKPITLATQDKLN